MSPTTDRRTVCCDAARRRGRPDAAVFDVFLSHTSADRPAVEVIGRRLREVGLEPFLDAWHLVPGVRWQDALTRALDASTTVAVFVGPGCRGPWQQAELCVALDRAVRSRNEFRLIPVLLPGADPSAVGGFLAQRTWVDFRSGLDDERALRRLAAGVRGEAYSDDRFELPDEPAPYRGLFRFDRRHARFFFGRSDDTERLTTMVRERSFVAVVGASGSGKSSLVRAGLLSHLDGVGPPDADWSVLVCTPGEDPFHSLAEEVARHDGRDDDVTGVDTLAARLRTRDDGLDTALGALRARGHHVLVVVDQLEELFTLAACDDWRNDAARFVANLATFARRHGPRAKVVVTLRADFVTDALSVPGMAAVLEDHQLLLGALGEDELREAIVRPAEQVGAMFEKGLVSMIVADVDHEPGALPLLQSALYELWIRRRGPWLTIDAYLDSGGVIGALSAHAEAVLGRLPDGQRRAIRAIFPRLAMLGEGVPDTRRRARRAELYPAGIERAHVDAALLSLSDDTARLVVIDGDAVEVAHEALLHDWARLRGWLDDDRETLRVHRRLSVAAHDWQHRFGGDAGALLAGARLAEADDFAAAHADQLTDLERRFLDASRAQRSTVRREVSEM